MKILIISSYLPYPLFSGGHVRLYNLMKELSSKHELTLICERRPNQTNQDITAVEKICKKVITVERKKQWSPGTIAKAATSSHSFLVVGHTNAEMQQKIKETLAHDPFDVIHVETFYVMQNLPKTNIPVVLAEHNIEYTVYEKFTQKAPIFLRPLLALDIAKIKREEELFWKHADRLLSVSKEDKKVMEQAGYQSTLIANGVDLTAFHVKQSKTNDQLTPKRILFMGDFRWIQNKDSATYIIEKIWPLLKSQKITAQLWIVGRNIPSTIRNLTHDQQVLFDEASSALPTEKIFQQADVLLAPIRVGGGSSYKILESMACGTPVVTMQMSADAIDAVDGQDIMVGQTAEALAHKTVVLLQEHLLYEKISKNGRTLIEKNYSWPEIAKKLESVYKDLV